MSAARAQRLPWLVGLLAVLLALGLLTIGTDRDRGRDGGVDRPGLAAEGAASERSVQRDASPGLLSPFTPVLDAVVTALTGSEGDAEAGRCLPSSWDSAARPTPNGRIDGSVLRDVDRTRVGPVSRAEADEVAALPC